MNALFKFRDYCSLLSRDLAEAFHLLEEVLVGAAAPYVPSRIGSFSIGGIISPSEVGVYSSISGKSSMGNYSPLSSLFGAGASQMMMASGRYTLLDGVLLGYMTGYSCLTRPVRVCQ